MNEGEIIDARLEFLGVLGDEFGVTWFDHQLMAFEGWDRQSVDRACLYFKTGAGKTLTSLTMMHMRGVTDVLVVTTPSTYNAWALAAAKTNVNVECISHAKFRMKNYKLSRNRAVIVDEFHMLGGHGGQGFIKLDTLAKHLKAPLIICSATPNYNDAERVYCVAHVLDPHGHKGGYLQFLYRHCQTEADPFSMQPKVLGFHHFKDAAEFLASLPGVYYLEDDLVYTIKDVPYSTPLPAEMESHGYNRRDHRIIASTMERKHTVVNHQLVDEDDMIHVHVMDILNELFCSEVEEIDGPVLIYCNHATVALALAGTFRAGRYFGSKGFGLVTGGMTTKAKAAEIQRFRDGKFDVLVGTASLATGTDGLDKMCDTLIILDDTDDDSLRRQLIGRIMPRGEDTDVSKKKVYRFVST